MDWKQALLEAFSSQLHILWEEPLAEHTSFRIGGAAQCMVMLSEESQLPQLLRFCHTYQVPFHCMGNGSNLLIDDAGVEGIVLCMGSAFSEISVCDGRLTAQAGALLGRVAQRAATEGLTGLEFAHGIPGSVGGGAIMNAGAYGGELSQVISQVVAYDQDGVRHVLAIDEMEMGYRTSIMKQRGMIVTQVTFTLQHGERAQIEAQMRELMARRRDKQPLEFPSAGSTFKRPPGYFAGKLIQDAGYRGYRIGDAQVSEKHCGFVINRGHATCEQVRALMQDVTEGVERSFGVTLEPEVIYWERTGQ